MPHPSAALIILPGLDGTGMRLGAFIERIGSEFDTQLIGFPVDTALDYAQLEAWVRARLPVGRPFALLAESFSGPLAVRIGAAPPAGLTAVILCGSFVRSPYPALAFAAPLLSRLPFRALPRWLRKLLLWNTGDRTAAPPAGERASARVLPGVITSRLRAVLAVDERRALRHLALPLLLIEGTDDRIVPRAAARAILAAAPQARHVLIAGPHLLLQTRPAQCAVAVAQFLRTLA